LEETDPGKKQLGESRSTMTKKFVRKGGIHSRRSQRGSNLAEFGPALWLFFLVFLFPLFNLVQFACGVATVALIARQAAEACAASPDFNTGLAAARTTASSMASSGFGKFACLKAANQYGITVYIGQTNIASGAHTEGSADTPLSTAVDPNNNIYQIETQCLYDIGPVFPMTGFPFIGDIPLVGKAYRLGLTSERTAEFPDGLTTVGNASSGSGSSGGTSSGS
jgi:hypothetical protein